MTDMMAKKTVEERETCDMKITKDDTTIFVLKQMLKIRWSNYCTQYYKMHP